MQLCVQKRKVNNAMTKITPQQAFEAAKILWPNCSHITKGGMYGFIYQNNTDYIGSRIEIDWPEGIDHWPQPAWRDATIQDFVDEREARFSESELTSERNPKQFFVGHISGHSRETGRWQRARFGDWYPYCQVREG